jgi:hypothetical protein
MPPNVERLMTVRCRPPIPGGRAVTWAWQSFALRDRASNEHSIFPTSCSLSVLIPESAIITKSAGAYGRTRQARIKRHGSIKYVVPTGPAADKQPITRPDGARFLLAENTKRYICTFDWFKSYVHRTWKKTPSRKSGKEITTVWQREA